MGKRFITFFLFFFELASKWKWYNISEPPRTKKVGKVKNGINGRTIRKEKGVLREWSAARRKMNERHRDHLWGQRGRISNSDPQLYQKMCCSLFSHASLSLFLSFSLYLFLSLPLLAIQLTEALLWGGGEGTEGWMEGGRAVLSSPLCLSDASRTKTPTLPPCVCLWVHVGVCVCACVWASEWVRRLIVEQDINNRIRLFTDDSAVNNLNRFPFENRLFF